MITARKLLIGRAGARSSRSARASGANVLGAAIVPMRTTTAPTASSQSPAAAATPQQAHDDTKTAPTTTDAQRAP